jgi:outer membrane cobalamin receptor
MRVVEGVSMRNLCATSAVLVLSAIAAPAFAADGDSRTDTPGTEIVVTAKRLDAARESIKPSLGASTYTLSSAAIQNLPGSDNQPINDIILQLPGVSQDQFGQFHVRDEHNGVQYRLNGVILPESIAVFGQTLSPRLIGKLDLVTGTLPAQYGLRTAGIIDITTKSGLKDETTVSLYGGSHGTIEPSVQLSGSSGGTTWFLSGDYKHNDLGIDNVTGATSAIHDKTDQYSAFGYIDHILSDNDRIAFTGGYSAQHYQIPNPAGQEPGNGYTVNGVSAFPSEQLNETQLQATTFGALSLLHNAGKFSAQASVFARGSALDYHPDVVGELLYNGMAQAAAKHDFAYGVQLDSVYKLNDRHTLRFGVIVSRDQSKSETQTSVFPTSGDINDPVLGFLPGPVSGPPINFAGANSISEMTYSVYLQDEWHIADRVVLNYGARFDENDGLRNERQLSPRANLVWTPGGGLTVHAGYARYFAPAPFEMVSSGNLAQLYGTTATPNVRTDNAPYAQRENYWDVGLQQKIGGAFTLGLDGYFRRSTHLVDEGQFGAPIILTPFNYAKGRIMGAELSLNYSAHGFSAYGNLSVDKAQGTGIDSSEYNFSATDLAYIASHYIYLDHNQTLTGSGGAAYRWSQGPLAGSRVSADVIYGSGLRKDGAVPNGAALSAYATVNFSLGHSFGTSGFDVRLDIENLFDKVYEIRDGTGVGVGAPSFGPRRGVFLGISKTL